MEIGTPRRRASFKHHNRKKSSLKRHHRGSISWRDLIWNLIEASATGSWEHCLFKLERCKIEAPNGVIKGERERKAVGPEIAISNPYRVASGIAIASSYLVNDPGGVVWPRKKGRNLEAASEQLNNNAWNLRCARVVFFSCAPPRSPCHKSAP